MKKAAVALVATLTVGLPAAASADTIKVQSTTDTVDAGLVDWMTPQFEAADPGDTLAYTAVGTGKALDNARAGLADVVITHAPSLEKLFVADGYSLLPAGRQIFYSDYVIVGPQSDPAQVATSSPHDAVGALQDIAAAGDTGTASFVSRGDNSGTNVQEQVMWKMTSGVTVQLAGNAKGDVTRAEPGSGGSYPVWYVQTNKGQAANLQDADVCAVATYPNGGCYTMVDRGTFNRLLNAGTITHLKIVSQNNAATAPGGANLLINPFSAYIVNPDKVPGANVAAAKRFVDFLTSPAFQTAVNGFPTATDPAFRADAFPTATLTSALPASATAGTAIPLELALANKLPGTPAVSGMPVQLQQSTDGGTTWTDAGAPRSTDAAGKVALAPTLSATTAYRVKLAAFQATDWSMFTDSVQDLGVVTLATGGGVTPLPPAKDHTPPKVTKVVLGPRKVALTVNEAGTVKIVVKQRLRKKVRSHGHVAVRVVYKTVKTITRKVAKPSRVTVSWKKPLAPGAYHVAVRATDRAHNSRVTTTAATIKKAKAKAKTKAKAKR